MMTAFNDQTVNQIWRLVFVVHVVQNLKKLTNFCMKCGENTRIIEIKTPGLHSR